MTGDSAKRNCPRRGSNPPPLVAKTQSFANALQRTYDSTVFNFVMICRILIVPSHLTFLQFFSMKMRSTPYGVKIKNDQWTQFYMIGLFPENRFFCCTGPLKHVFIVLCLLSNDTSTMIPKFIVFEKMTFFLKITIFDPLQNSLFRLKLEIFSLRVLKAEHKNKYNSWPTSMTKSLFRSRWIVKMIRNQAIDFHLTRTLFNFSLYSYDIICKYEMKILIKKYFILLSLASS